MHTLPDKMSIHPSPPITPINTPFITPLHTAPPSRSTSPERSNSHATNTNLAPPSSGVMPPTPVMSPSKLNQQAPSSTDAGTPRSHSDHATDGPTPGQRKRNQVKRACVNCQKACKKCDNGRPCSRCIKFGLEKTCADSARKERQRVGVKRGPYKRMFFLSRNGMIMIGLTVLVAEAGRPANEDMQEESFAATSGLSKLDILSRLCNTVLVHARESDGSEKGSESPTEDLEVMAAKSLEIIANRARGVEPVPEQPPVPTEIDSTVYEYDHQRFDHRCLVQDAVKALAPFGKFSIDDFAATLNAASAHAGQAAAYGSLYPFTSMSGFEALSSSGALNPNTLRFPSFGGFGAGYGSMLFETSTVPKAREPNPLDDFAAISDTVRKMEDEASARSKKRTMRRTVSGGSIKHSLCSLFPV
ncbi:hypothetical protein DFS34DRAFT_626627 [Phlyctochytrium arcticum]|nr:hypothetical protein DFS34DRAFT_626627 [Phlyctochytrium arcticum]